MDVHGFDVRSTSVVSNAAATSSGSSRIPNSTSQRAHARSVLGRSAPNAGAPAVNAGATASSCAASASRSSPGSAARHRRDRALGVALDLAVAALQRADRRAHDRARRPRASRASRTARAPGSAARRSRRRGTRGCPAAARAARRPRRSRTPSRPRPGAASSALTAWKPIVVVRTCSGSPPSPATTERSTASSDGSPLTPARSPSSVGGRADRRLREHRRERPLHERHHADDVACPPGARARGRGCRGSPCPRGRPASSRSASVDAPGLRISSSTPSASSYVALGRHVEPGVDRVRA